MRECAEDGVRDGRLSANSILAWSHLWGCFERDEARVSAGGLRHTKLTKRALEPDANTGQRVGLAKVPFARETILELLTNAREVLKSHLGSNLDDSGLMCGKEDGVLFLKFDAHNVVGDLLSYTQQLMRSNYEDN